VILMLGGPRFTTLEVEIYLQTMQFLNLPLSGVLSLLQLGCTMAVTAVYLGLNRRNPIPLAPRLSPGGLWDLRTFRQRLLVWSVVFAVVVLLLAPLLAIVMRSFFTISSGGHIEVTLDYFRELFINRRRTFFFVPPITAIRNSLLYGGLTVLISMTLGFTASVALNQRGRLSRLMNIVLMLPLGTSAVTLGLGFLVVFNRPPFDLRTFPWLVPIAHSLVALPFVVRTVQPALASIPPVLRQAAAVLGADPSRVRREVDLPIVARACAAGAVFAFSVSLGEFGATSFIARPEYPTLPVAIFRFLSQPGEMNYGQSMAMAAILMVICAAAVLVIDQIEIK